MASCTPPARRGGKCFGGARRLRIVFRSTAFSPKSDARTPAHGGQAVRTPKGPSNAGRNTTDENLRRQRVRFVIRISSFLRHC